MQPLSVKSDQAQLLQYLQYLHRNSYIALRLLKCFEVPRSMPRQGSNVLGYEESDKVSPTLKYKYKSMSTR